MLTPSEFACFVDTAVLVPRTADGAITPKKFPAPSDIAVCFELDS